ncbi:MAG: hypothetical protein BM556_10970 [Bacteriovorax sp. MedPE-SWde]|nr:MAG: hypothetical protein BM556_10970 [Bacteriovorax sp. MedPE-SWde]
MRIKRLVKISLLLSLPTLSMACKDFEDKVNITKNKLSKKYNGRMFKEVDFTRLKSEFSTLSQQTQSLRNCQKQNQQFLTSCRFKVKLLQEQHRNIEVAYSEAATLDDSMGTSCSFYSTKRFKFYKNRATDKILLTDINGIFGLRSYLDCRLDDETETNRRINISSKSSTNKYTKLTVIDDWLYPDTKPDQYGDYPLGIQALINKNISIDILDDSIRLSIGKYFIQIEAELGKITKSNLFTENFYDNGRCHSKIDQRTQKLIPHFNFVKGTKFPTKIISY